MRGSIFSIVLTLFVCFQTKSQDLPTMSYEIDMTQSKDTFMISLEPKGKLNAENNLFQFASTAPGTYQTMNIGRLVSGFEALDRRGRPLPIKQVSVNQYEIESPKKVHSLRYKVAETHDTLLPEYPIYPMAGSSLEEDHALINAHTMLGYFQGLQKSTIEISLKKREGWIVGTALNASGKVYVANDYDHAVDSPILLGKLTHAETMVANTKVEIYTYSKNDKISSDRLLESMSNMLEATQEFLINLPVDRYTFLYHFDPTTRGQTGAWEHSYSSEYTLIENDFNTPQQVQAVADIASHEFFHIVTPLNIHSEVVETFNFVEPISSLHLWLYEGITEWASNMLLYRSGDLTLADYLDGSVRQKIIIDGFFDSSWSLEKLAKESFTTVGARQYANIYMRGSLFGNLLDIRLLELSEGEFGLREVLLDLVKQYGKGKPISEETFIDDFVAMTFPEIKKLFDDHVFKAKKLPLKEYFAKVGILIKGSGRNNLIVEKMENLSTEQQLLFEAWSRNLDR